MHNLIKDLLKIEVGARHPVPSDNSMKNAEEFLDFADKNNLHVKMVDTDIMGGIAVFLRQENKEIYYTAFNEAEAQAIVAIEGDKVLWALDIDENNKQEILNNSLTFLRG